MIVLDVGGNNFSKSARRFFVMIAMTCMFLFITLFMAVVVHTSTLMEIMPFLVAHIRLLKTLRIVITKGVAAAAREIEPFL
jgi:hypothetical protein